MKDFKELGINPKIPKGFTGTKVKIYNILNKEIVVHGFKVVPSKFNTGKCLHLQISISETMHVVFGSYTRLIDVLEQIPVASFPFKTTIIKPENSFQFS